MNHDSSPHGKVRDTTESPTHRDNVSEFSGLPLGLQRIIRLLEGEDPTATIYTDNTQDKGKRSLSDDHIYTPNVPSPKTYTRPK